VGRVIWQEGNTMSTEANKTLVRRLFEEVVVSGKLDSLEELIHEDYVDYTQPPGWPTDRAGLGQLVLYFHSAFPDIHVTIHEIIAEEDLVAERQTFRAFHRGEFFGIPATGRRVEMSGTHFFRIANGKIIEHRANNDDLGMLRQLGVIPSPQGQDAV
jgi:steroid delta-isomerase-like uncharacterized protein